MMKEIIEFRINKQYADLLFYPNEGQDLGDYQIIKIKRDDPRYEKIGLLRKEIEIKYKDYFFMYWNIERKYIKKELDVATLLHLMIKTTFEPTGEECGTLYDETVACEICGANRQQVSPLILKKSKIPKKDVARTIGGEVIISEKFANVAKQWNLKGLEFRPVNVARGISYYYQLIANVEIELSRNTIAGVNPFDFSESSEEKSFIIPNGHHVKFEKEVYKCPKGHTIGLNLLSEPCVLYSPIIREYDFFSSKQKIGVKRGLLRPESSYFCSQIFRKMIEEEKLTGFEIEIANVEQ